MDGEFILNDLIAVERKLEKLNEERHKGGARDKAIIDGEGGIIYPLSQRPL